MAVNLAGNVSNQAGTAKVGLTVELWEKSAYEGSGSRTGSTTTDSQGNWAFTGQDITKLWLVVVVDGTKKVLPVHSEGSQQLTKLDLITDMNVDTINEHTAAAGVTIDSVVVKDGGLTTTGAVTVGSDGSGADVIFYSGTAGDNLTWDASAKLLTITGTDTTTALNVADGNVTIADDLTVSGNLTVTGTTTSVDSTTINAATAFVFEGATADAHETTLGIVDPTADATINLPAMSAGTYYLPVLAAASTTSVTSTPAELNLLDGSSANTVVNSKAVIYGSSGEVAGTLSTAAQTSVTSLGTLTALTVDDVAVNGKVVTMTGSTDDTAVLTVGTNGTLSLVTTDTAAAAANIQITADGTVDIDSAGVLTLDSGAAINIEPAAGSAVLIDGNVSIDGDAVTGIATLSASGVITAGGFTIGSAAINEAELEILDGATVTTTELNLLDALDRGSILYGNSSGVTTVLGQGSANEVLTSDGTDIAWAAAGGGGATAYEGGQTTEATTSSTSIADMMTSSTLDIAALVPVDFEADARGDNVATAGGLGFKVNSTVIRTATTGGAQRIWSKAGISTAQSGGFWIHLGPRLTDYVYYIGGQKFTNAGTSNQESYPQNGDWAASIPIATITAIVITGILAGGSTSVMGVDELHVYSKAVS